MSERNSRKILEEIAQLKKELGNNPEMFLEKVKALALMYGAFQKGTEGRKTDEAIKVLGVQIGQIQKAAAELQKVNISAGK